MPSYTLNWNDLNSATAINVIDKSVPDQIFADTILMLKLKEQAEYIDGGEDFTVPVEYGKSKTGTYEKFETHDVEASERFTTARFTLGQYYSYITIAQDDFDKNNGSPKIFDLVEKSWMNAMNTLEEDISDDLYRDGVTSVTGSKCIVGLKAAVAIDPTTGTYGAIDRSTASWWRNKTWDYSAVGAIANFDQYDVNKFLLQINGRKDRVNLIVTTKDIWNQLYEKADAAMRMPWKTAYEIGVQSLTIGGVPVIYDESVTAGYCYFLNTDYLRFIIAKNNNFKASNWLIDKGQFAQTKYLTTSMQLICTKPRRQGVIFNID